MPFGAGFYCKRSGQEVMQALLRVFHRSGTMIHLCSQKKQKRDLWYFEFEESVVYLDPAHCVLSPFFLDGTNVLLAVQAPQDIHGIIFCPSLLHWPGPEERYLMRIYEHAASMIFLLQIQMLISFQLFFSFYSYIFSAYILWTSESLFSLAKW